MSYLPEGMLCDTAENQILMRNISSLQDCIQNEKILEARAVICDGKHNLIVDLNCMTGIIPREEGAIGIDDGSTRDIAIISKVNKPVCFIVTKLGKDENGKSIAYLSRKKAQELCMEHYLSKLVPGDIIPAKVTHLESFGCFVDIGCGISSLIPIDLISVSRISHPRDRFKNGQEIQAIVKFIESDGKICLSHKELLGTWEENAKNYNPGETVAGIIRSVEEYGVFVELTPNLAGLAELKKDVQVGQHASVYIKSLIPEKMKVKLIIVDSFDAEYASKKFEYYITGDHIDYFKYSPDSCPKVIETIFN